MTRLMGRVVVHHSTSILKYYLSGSRRDGYTITIMHEKDNESFIRKSDRVIRSTVCAMRLCNMLARGIVFPDQLNEIIEDQI